MSSESIQIQRRSDGSFVEAALLDGMAPDDFILVGNDGGDNHVKQEQAKRAVA